MAREVYGAHTEWSGAPLDRMEQLVALVRADEREKWAKVCDEIDKDSQSQWPKRLATMIRARGNT